MNRIQRAERIKQLKENGYKRVPDIPYIYLNESGKVYSLQKDRELKPTSKNLVRIENGYLNVPKLMLWIFRNEPMRANQQIRYINGDRGDLSIENVEYTRKYKNGLKVNVNNENLYTAIRCYFNVPKKYKVKDRFRTRMYLSEILEKRGFYIDNRHKEGIEVFKSYMQDLISNHTIIAQKHNISIWDCAYIVNGFLNQLSSEILRALNTGILQVKDFKLTKRQELRELNKQLISYGLNPVRLRKKSNKELLKDYEKFCNEFKTK